MLLVPLLALCITAGVIFKWYKNSTYYALRQIKWPNRPKNISGTNWEIRKQRILMFTKMGKVLKWITWKDPDYKIPWVYLIYGVKVVYILNEAIDYITINGHKFYKVPEEPDELKKLISTFQVLQGSETE